MTIQARLDERYGRSSSAALGRVLWTAVVITGALAVGVLAWFAVAGTADTVRADDTGFTVLDERTVSVSFQVSGPSDREIACAIEALDAEFGVVGWKVVVIPPTGQMTRAYTEEVPTLSLATTGVVNSCWVV